MTAKERNLLKGAIRRVFARSELRLEALKKVKINHFDPNRKRVTKWSRCPQCNENTPSYLMVVDHILPIIPVNLSLEEMSWDEVVDATWCDKNNLQAICKTCHNKKTKEERAARKAHKTQGTNRSK